jgi:2-polyprenyl-3-methyl-5-hydroxy-6-metoxy-1,4-benzoquinol methylase
MDLVKQTFWDKKYEESVVVPQISRQSALMEWIDTVCSLKKEGACLEIGVFPGGYVNLFGARGYTISGIDVTPRVVELNDVFCSRNYSIGAFLQQDFFEYRPDNKYDIVYSMGFIEHFIDYKNVIERHCDLVADNGILFITVPNFRGRVQHFLHKLLDNENLKRHNTASMNPKEWEGILIEKNFEIIRQGYIGTFEFWTGIKNKHVKITVHRMFKFVVSPILRLFLSKPSPSYAPTCGIIAKKKMCYV